MDTSEKTGLRAWELPPPVELAMILRWSIKQASANRLQTAIRLDQRTAKPDASAAQAIAALHDLAGDRILVETDTSAWPGTELIGHVGRVFVLELDLALAEALAETEPILGNWTHFEGKPLPEDLCAFQEGAPFPAFYSVTHESDTWVLAKRQPKLPGIQLSLRNPEDLLIPRRGKKFLG